MTRRTVHAEITRIYNIPEKAKGNNTEGFKEKLFQDCLDFLWDAELKTETAHRVLVPMPTNVQSQPCTIFVKVDSYKTIERLCVDYPPAILKKHAEYS